MTDQTVVIPELNTKSMLDAVTEDEWWDSFKLSLLKVITPITAKSVAEAAKESVITLSNLGLTIDWDLINNYAKIYALAYNYDLISGITASTKESLKYALTTGIEASETMEQIISGLSYTFSAARAKMIATTETTRIFANANMKFWDVQGVPSKTWMTANDELVCDICGPMDGKTVDLKTGTYEAIFSGDSALVLGPPAHVMCRCYLQPSMDISPEDPNNFGVFPDDFDEDDPQAWIRNNLFENTDPPKDLAEILAKWEENKYGPIPYGEWSKLDVNVANWASGLTERQLEEVRHYTGGGASVWNRSLRVANGNESAMSAQSLDGIRRVSAALEKNNPWGQDIVIYRGVSGQGGLLLKELAKTYKMGDSYLDYAFLSTSISENQASGFSGGAILKILNPGGAVGQYVAPYSHYKSELEWLLPRGTELIILKVEWMPDRTPTIWCVIKETMQNLKFMIFGDIEVKRVSEPKVETEEIDRPSSIWEEVDSLQGMVFTINGFTFTGSEYEEMSELINKVLADDGKN